MKKIHQMRIDRNTELRIEVISERRVKIEIIRKSKTTLLLIANPEEGGYCVIRGKETWAEDSTH